MAENIQEKSFEGQRDGEVVIKVFRRHMIAMRKGFYGLLIPLALSSIPPLIWQTNLELFFTTIGWIDYWYFLFAYQFIIWYYTVFVLTNQRLRQITQKGFLVVMLWSLSCQKYIILAIIYQDLAERCLGLELL